jgi:hypothetical protein
VLVERTGYVILEDRVSATGTCPECSRAIPGFWEPDRKRLFET